MKLIPKCQYNSGNAFGKLAERNDATTVRPVYFPEYRSTLVLKDNKLQGNGNTRLTNTGGTTKSEVNEGVKNAHKANINKVRSSAERASAWNTSSKVLGQIAADEAEKAYREETGTDVEADRPIEINDEANLKYKDGSYVYDDNGNLVENPNWDKPWQLKLARTGQNILNNVGLTLSLIPHPVTRAAGNAIFYGQTAADTEYDLRHGNYGAAAVDAGSVLVPWGINKLYQKVGYLKGASKMAENPNYDSEIWNARRNSSTNYYKDLDAKIQDDLKNYSEEINKARDIHVSRTYNRPIDQEALAEETKKVHQQYNENLVQQKDPKTTITINGKEVTVRPRLNVKTGATNEASPELAEYLQNIENTLGDAGMVTGSTRLYGSGIMNGVPHDLEVLTTKSRLDEVKKALGEEGAEYYGNNGYKQSLKGKDFVFNSEGAHTTSGSHDIDVQIIGEDAKGFATGDLAHNYYSRLYPEEYKKLQATWEKMGEKAIRNGDIFNTTEQSLPITAEELYNTLHNNPKLMDKLVALDNYNTYKIGRGQRQAQILANPELSSELQRMNMNAVTNDWEFIKLSPEEIQQARVQFKIPDSYPDSAVESIVNQNLISDSFGVRSVFNRHRNTPWSTELENDALKSVVAPYNGQASGIGGNQLLHSSKGGVGGDVTAILNNRHDIHSFQDYIKSIQHRVNPGSELYAKFDKINKAVGDGSMSIAEGTKQTEDLAKMFNIPGFYGKPYNNAVYFGALQRPTIGLKNYTSKITSEKSNILEVGRTPEFNTDYSALGLPAVKSLSQNNFPRFVKLPNNSYQQITQKSDYRWLPNDFWRHNRNIYIPSKDLDEVYKISPVFRKYEDEVKHGIMDVTNFTRKPILTLRGIGYNLPYINGVIPILGGIKTALDEYSNWSGPKEGLTPNVIREITRENEQEKYFNDN